MPWNVYVHACNKCHHWSQLLHEKECLLCRQPNAFFDPSIKVARNVIDEVREIIIELDTYLRKGVETPGTEVLGVYTRPGVVVVKKAENTAKEKLMIVTKD